MEILVQSGSSVLLYNDDGDTALHVSAVRGNYAIVRYLCERGSDMNSVNKVGVSLLCNYTLGCIRMVKLHFILLQKEIIWTLCSSYVSKVVI